MKEGMRKRTDLEEEQLSVPARVHMMPLMTIRMRWFAESAIYILPDESTQIPRGLYRFALVALLPSPDDPITPFPATVVMIPVTAFTKRIRLLNVSPM